MSELMWACAALFYGVCCFLLGYLVAQGQPEELGAIYCKPKKPVAQNHQAQEILWANIEHYGTNAPQREIPHQDRLKGDQEWQM